MTDEREELRVLRWGAQPYQLAICRAWHGASFGHVGGPTPEVVAVELAKAAVAANVLSHRN